MANEARPEEEQSAFFVHGRLGSLGERCSGFGCDIVEKELLFIR